MNYRQFVRLLASSSEESVGATIVAYRPRDAQLAIIPWVDGELLDGDNERLDEFPGLAGWWREQERVWNRNKADVNQLTLPEQIAFQSKLGKQFPIAEHLVVYTKSGRHIAACRLDDPRGAVS